MNVSQEEIFWNKDRLLTWDDFKGEPVQDYPHDAHSGVGWDYSYDTDIIPTRGGSFKFQFKQIRLLSRFSLESWAKKDKISESGLEPLLKHEQGHFDLCEEFCRKTQKSLNEEFMNKKFRVKGKTREEALKNARKVADKLLMKKQKEMRKQHKEIQKKYEAETNHGIILKKQEEYNNRFDLLRK